MNEERKITYNKADKILNDHGCTMSQFLNEDSWDGVIGELVRMEDGYSLGVKVKVLEHWLGY